MCVVNGQVNLKAGFKIILNNYYYTQFEDLLKSFRLLVLII